MTTEEVTNHEAAGVPLDRFCFVVDSISRVRDEGEAMIFCSPIRGVKIVGKVRSNLRGQIFNERPLTDNDVMAVVDEVESFLDARLHSRSTESAARMLARNRKLADLDDTESEQREKSNTLINQKLQHLEKVLFSGVLQNRFDRAKSTTGSLLEELEFELVSNRVSSVSNPTVSDRIVRIRLRHSVGVEIQPALEMFGFIKLPFGQPKLHSFEMECDEHDIDLMVMRLVEAKTSLINYRESIDRG